MSMRSWLRNLFTRPAARTIRKAPRRARLSLEALEDRTVPSTFTVYNTNDSGAGSLRDAITQAQAGTNLGVADTIVFNNNSSLGANFYDSTPDTITLTSGQLALTDTAATTISGPGANLLAISGNHASRVFAISSGAPAALTGLRISAGNAGIGGGVNSDNPEDGGGVLNFGSLELTDCTVSGNAALQLGGGISSIGTINLTRCTVRDNSGNYGGGLFSSGSLTLTDCTVRGNSASLEGGGIFSSGTTTLAGCTVRSNAASQGAGGIFSSGTTTLAQCTVRDNSAAYGAGLGGTGDTTTLTNCTVSGNSASKFGGGFEEVRGAIVLTDCTVSGNSAGDFGGGFFAFYGSATLTNCTVSGNSSGQIGGGGCDEIGNTTLTNCTISNNVAGTRGGGFIELAGSTTLTNCTVSGNSATDGGGLYLRYGTVTVGNTIVAGNAATDSAPDAFGFFASVGHNLVGKSDGSTGWAGSDLTGTAAVPRDPRLAPLGDYGGPTQTMAPLQGCPAIDEGDNALIPAGVTTDQRGADRVARGGVDIGAFELADDETITSILSVVTGDHQSTLLSTAFATPLQVRLIADGPVAGAVITFTVNPGAGGAGATLSGGTATIGADGTASVTVTANAVVGRYTVTASVAGAWPVTFHLGNAETPGLVVTTEEDVVDPFDGLTSLREAINLANALSTADTITFDPIVFGTPETIPLTGGPLTLTDTARTTITGPGANLLAVSGKNVSRVFSINSGASAALSGLTITRGIADSGGGVFNSGTATLTNCTVSGNNATPANEGYGDGSGGGVFNSGTVTLINCTVSGNTATGNGGYSYSGGGGDGSGSGGGVFNSGMATLINCTVSGNAATGTGGGSFFGGGGDGSGSGGGVSNSGMATLTNCTVSGNTATGTGGGSFAGGGGGDGSGSGGGISGSGFTVANTIIAGNTVGGNGPNPTADGPDAFGNVTSLGHNLVGIADDSSGWVGSDLTDASAAPLNLGPLADNGGPTQTMALLPGSRAINAGSNDLAVDANSVALAYDQRGPGYPRIHGGTVDIGAFEVNIASQTITFGPLADQTYGVAPITLSATASSGLPVSYQVISGPATLLGNVLTITGAGTVVVQATQAGDASYASADPVTQSFNVAKAKLTGDATTQDALNLAKQGKLTITISNVAGLVNGDKLATVLCSAHYFITVTDQWGTRAYEFIPTTVTTSGGSITITYSLKNSALAASLAAELADNTSAATAASAGFLMESMNYTLTDDHLSRLFSTVK